MHISIVVHVPWVSIFDVSDHSFDGFEWTRSTSWYIQLNETAINVNKLIWIDIIEHEVHNWISEPAK